MSGKVETQQQWSALAIVRSTPTLLGLFSLVTLMAHQPLQGQDLVAQQAVWYRKSVLTCVDTLALVHQQLRPY